tara:strand:+ start:792 stop:1286 length:495 start_codon:yes stop_codon:yes gene_type:complete
MTFEEYLRIEMEYFNPHYDQFYQGLGLRFRRVNRKTHDVEISMPRIYRIEEKTRMRYYEDMLVEEVQDTETKKPGWLYYCKAQRLLYSFANAVAPYAIYLTYSINWPIFLDWYMHRREEFEGGESTQGYGRTLNRYVPMHQLLHEGIAKKVFIDFDVMPSNVGA